MKNKAFLPIFLMLFPLFYSNPILTQCNDLIITAVFDGPLNGAPRGIELYAKQNISDLSTFSIGSATNGGGSDGEEFQLPMRTINAGTFLYVSRDSVKFHDFFDFAPDMDLIPSTNASVGFLNGDDAIELFCNGQVVDIYGEITHSSSGLNWNYEDGWAYRLSGTGPDGITFKVANWTVDRNALDGAMSNSIAIRPVPIATYDTFPACNRLLITGIYDGPLPGGEPQGIELFVTKDIPDLSLFGFGSITNGNGSNGIEVDFPIGAVEANTFLYLTSDSASFHDFFGFAPTMISGSASINGDDAVELFCKQGTHAVIDVFGEPNVDGTGEIWEYTDGWTYRKDETIADGNFTSSNWTFGGLNALEGGITNEEANVPFPIGTYQSDNVINCPKIKALPLGDILNGTYEAVDSLIAQATIPKNSNVTLHAGQVILLRPGFHAVGGSEFLAKIKSCTADFQEMEAPNNFVMTERRNVNKKDAFVNITSTFEIKLYPNPTSTALNLDLKLNQPEQIQLQLLDLSGRVIKLLQSKQLLTNGTHQLWFDLNELDAGVFWLKITGEQEYLVEKVIIMK